MELEGIMLSEISQSEKDNYHMVSLIIWFMLWNIRNSVEDHSRREGKRNGKKSERGTNDERLWTLGNKLRVTEGRWAGGVTG